MTGAVCNSLAMIGTRGGALLEALRPTLLQLLRHRSKRGRSGGERANRGKKQAAAGGGGGGGGGDHVSIVRSPDEESLAAMLQGQRAAMACVLCCWEGLDAGGGADSCSSVSAPAAAGSAKANNNNNNGSASKSAPSPLSALEKPVAAACVWAMKTAGTAAAAEKARGARLLRPVLVLVKRWPALLPLMLELIVKATSEATTKPALSVGGEGAAAVQGGIVGGVSVGVGGSQSLEPVLRCLQAVVRDPGLQGQLRRRHVGVLRESAGRLCVELDGSPLKGVVVQLRADVDVLCGGRGVDGLMR